MNKMKQYVITDAKGEKITSIAAGNGKAALKRFQKSCTATGFYEVHKVEGVWTLSTSFGAYYTAIEDQEGEKDADSIC